MMERRYLNLYKIFKGEYHRKKVYEVMDWLEKIDELLFFMIFFKVYVMNLLFILTIIH
jgi:hypothetical protein